MTTWNRHKIRMKRAFGVAVLAALISTNATAQVGAPPDPLSLRAPDPTIRFKDIQIQQRLDAQIPMDLPFVDEDGNTVQFGDYLGDRPAILALVYYECPMLCTLVLNGLEQVLSAMKYRVGEDFDVITVSIDPGETPELASRKKIAHLESMNMPGAGAGWHFLTGQSLAIDTLAETVGFGYAYDASTDQYAHAAGIMVVTATGKVSRYYYGIEYIPRDVEFGLIEASDGKVGTLVDQLILLCFAYDPAAGTYGVYVIGAMRVLAVLTILGLLTFWVSHYLMTRKKGTGQASTDTLPHGTGNGAGQ